MATGVKSWSTTDANNATADSTIGWAEGQSPASVNDSARAMMGRIADWYLLIDGGTVSGGTVGGTADAITLTNSPTVDALAHGQRYLFRAGSANTGAVTLNVDSLGATALRYRDTALVANDIAAGDIVLCMYDSNTTRFQMLTPPRLGAVSTVAATQAQMEAASVTNAPVTPGRTQYHPGVAKAWCNYNTVTSTSVTASHNVGSLTDNGTGDTTFNWTTAFSTAQAYTFALGVKSDGAETTAGQGGMRDAITDMATASLRLITRGGGSTAYDTDLACVSCHGDQ